MAKSHHQTVISWKAPEFIHHKKNEWWFPILALVTLALATLFVLTGQFFPAIVIVLGGIVVYRLAHQEPAVHPVSFSTEGISFSDRFWSYRALQSFWLIQTSQPARLYIQPIRRFSFPVAIPIVAEDIEKVRDFLGEYLPENETVQEDLADVLLRWLKI